ncbi:MAG TPA: hypothetical protein VGA49_01020 [Patescibacteria group bacterium]
MEQKTALSDEKIMRLAAAGFAIIFMILLAGLLLSIHLTEKQAEGAKQPGSPTEQGGRSDGK